jgi:integrase
MHTILREVIMMERTPETEEAYLYRAENLLKRYTEETLKHWAVDMFNFCDWLAEHRTVWQHATWRQNKAAVIYFMQQNGPKEIVDYLTEIHWDSKFKKKSQKAGKTSSQKAKRIKEKDLSLLLERFKKGQGEMDILLGLWFLSGIITGLRPNEWDTVVLIDKVLIIQNSKNTNDRSFGPTRKMHLVKYSEEEMGNITTFLALLDEFKVKDGYSFDKIYQKCRRRLRNITRQLFPRYKKYPTLYTCRHHFASELKSSNYSLIEAAALMGHATDETLTTHYGKKEWGSGTFDKVQSDPDDQNKIKTTFQPLNKRSVKLQN